jgi:hypothetical protein
MQQQQAYQQPMTVGQMEAQQAQQPYQVQFSFNVSLFVFEKKRYLKFLSKSNRIIENFKI